MRSLRCLWGAAGLAFLPLIGMSHRGYPEETKLIPLQGYNFATRFATCDQIDRILKTAALMPPSLVFDDEISLLPSICGCVQVPAAGDTIDLLFKMAALPDENSARLSSFLCEHALSIGQLCQACAAIKIIYDHGIFDESQVMIHHRQSSKVVSWEPSCFVPEYGKVKNKFIYFDPDLSIMVVQPQRFGDAHFGRLVVIKRDGAVVKPFALHKRDELKLLLTLACMTDAAHFACIETYPTIEAEGLKYLLLNAHLEPFVSDAVRDVCEG